MNAVDGAPAGGWERLSSRAVLPHLRGAIGAIVPIAVIVIIRHGTPTGQDWVRAGIVAAIFLLVSAAETSRVLTTRFRATESGLEVRRGLLRRSRTTVPADRVRRFDTTAGPLQRVLGIVIVRIAAAGGETIALDAVTRATAERLRARFHPHRPAPGDAVIASYQPGWIRYAPLTIWGVTGFGILAGLAYKAGDALGLPVDEIWQLVGSLLGEGSLWETIGIGIVAVVVVGTLLALASYVLEWRGYLLADDGTSLALTRGALTVTKLSLRRNRVIGIDLVDTLLTRPAHAARVEVIAAGLGGDRDEADGDDDLKALTPTIDRPAALSIASRLLGTGIPDDGQLLPRPRAARRRRLFEALRAGLVLVAIAALSWLPWPGAPALAITLVAAVLAASFVPLALLEHRRMSHLLTDRHLVARAGALVTRTSIIDRRRIIGWATRQTWFQRRHHLITLTIVVAAHDRKGITLLDLDQNTATAIIRATSGAARLPNETVDQS